MDNLPPSDSRQYQQQQYGGQQPQEGQYQQQRYGGQQPQEGQYQQQPYPGQQYQQQPYPGQQYQQQPYPGQQPQPQWVGAGQQPQQPQYMGQMAIPVPQKSWLTTVLLCHFLGTLGIHRFYTGRIVSGIFQLLTGGGFGIWVLIDIIMIVTGEFKDQYGRPLYHVPVTGGSKSWVTTALLCMFLGSMGVHRFYTGRIVSGIFQLITFGGFGIWTLVDLIMIYTDNFTDGSNMPLTRLAPAL